MDEELIKKQKSKRTKLMLTVVVLGVFLVAAFWGFKVMGVGDQEGKETPTTTCTDGDKDCISEKSGTGSGGKSSDVKSDIKGSGAGSGDATGTCTVAIECTALAKDMSALKKQELKEYVPKDGIILAKTKYRFTKEETVYDALEKLCRENDIQLETKEDAVYKSRYIKSINYLYEKDAGKSSGWLYTVNGKTPGYGASKVKIADGDEIVWFYTVDYETDDRDTGMTGD